MRALPLALLLCSVPALADESSSRKILLVGDSHTAGVFGQTLHGLLRTMPATTAATFGVCSARPKSSLDGLEHSCGYWFRDYDDKQPSKWVSTREETYTDSKGQEKKRTWVKTPKLDALIAEFKPDMVVVALGSNQSTSADDVKDVLALIHKTRGSYGGASCVWVGPPYMRSIKDSAIDGVYETLKGLLVDQASGTAQDAKKSCVFTDSRALSYLRYPAEGGDGLHYSYFSKKVDLSGLAKQWAADAYSAISPLAP